MAGETMTVGELRRQLARKLCNADKLDKKLLWEADFALQAAFRDLIQVSHAQSALSVTANPIVLVDGTATYHLDEDVAMLVDDSLRIVESPYTTLVSVSQQQYDAWNTRALRATGRPTCFFMHGLNAVTGRYSITLHPTPSSAADGNTLSYMKVMRLPSVIGADDETPLDRRCPPGWHHYLVPGALRWMPDYVGTSWPVWEKMWNQYLLDARRTAFPIVGWSEQRERFSPSRGHGQPFAPVDWPVAAP